MARKPRREWGSGSLFQTSKGYWRVSVPVPSDGLGRRRKEWQFRTETAARRQLEAVQRRLARGLPAAESTVTLAMAAQDWLDSHDGKPHTVATYRSIVRHQLGDLAAMPVARHWPTDIERLLREREKEGYSGRTRRLILDVMRWTLRRCERDGIVERNVAELVKAPRLDAKEPVHFTAEQARRFLDAARDDDLFALYALALGTGLRRGELLALTWRDFGTGLDEAVVHRGKTRAAVRRVPVPSFAAVALSALPRRPGPVFPASPSYVSRHFKVICRQAGLPELTFHGLRHSAASIMLAEGVPMEIVRQVIGHSRIAMTGHYARAEDDMKRDALERLGKAIAG